MKPLQIPADRNGIGEVRTVIEFQQGHSAGRVLCEEFGRAALAGQNINFFQRKFDAFFRREDTNPPRVRRLGMIVKLHGWALQNAMK